MSTVESRLRDEPMARGARHRAPFRDAQIDMAHGAGGLASRRLVQELIAPVLLGPHSAALDDAALVRFESIDVAFTTDAFVVRPLRFPGGSIGELAVNGTVNDLAVSGATPSALLASFVLEAGLASSILEDELHAMAAAARRAGVAVLGGDTKVVEHGHADAMYITTSGIGRMDPRVSCSSASVRPGDQVLLSGHVGDHGITILLARGEVDLQSDLCSDTRSVLPMVTRLIESVGPAIRWMRDPTRGGVASALNELARDANMAVAVYEERVPVRDAVRGACELLGLDVLHVANEGQFLAVVAPDKAEVGLEAIRSTPGGEHARIIGEVREQPRSTVLGVSSYGGVRAIDMLVGDPLPRIC